MRLGLVVATVLLVAPSFTVAQPDHVAEGDFVIRDFRFASGESLPELRLHYLTLGTPRRSPTGAVVNAVLILHGTTGTGRTFLSPDFADELFGPGQPLDTAKYFVVLPDSPGHGRSSKPSDGLRTRFPRYTYRDMVLAQHRLVTEGLGVEHLRLLVGTSMGCMHTWLWGIAYPTFADGLVPLACAPTAIAGRNRMMRRSIIDDIRLDPAWQNGDYAAQPAGLRAALSLIFVMTQNPLQLQRRAPSPEAADRYVTEWIQARAARTDANDLLYAFDASRDYDPAPDLERVVAPVLAINSADDLINPPELGLMDRLMPRVRRGRYVLIAQSDATRGHLTHSVPALWKQHLEAFLATLPAAE
jgi:homoserine O-acetyltransferase/O-succinyltransferase